jgi:hypothetical protein
VPVSIFSVFAEVVSLFSVLLELVFDFVEVVDFLLDLLLSDTSVDVVISFVDVSVSCSESSLF